MYLGDKIKKVMKNGSLISLVPEANYSHCIESKWKISFENKMEASQIERTEHFIGYILPNAKFQR